MKLFAVVLSLILPCLSSALPLTELEKTTFTCPAVGLNAAAQAAAAAPTQGTYQFVYFKVLSDSAQAQYKVGFKSNYPGERDLYYIVDVYCQSGITPVPHLTLQQ